MGILSTFRFFYLLGAVNALFFAILVFSKKNRTLADKLLGSWLLILFGQLFIPFLYLADLNKYFEYAGIEIVFYVFHPFLLLLYIKATIGDMPSWKVMTWNILIIVISTLFAISFLFIPAKERLSFIEGQEFLPWYYVPLVLLMTAYFSFNLYASYKALKDYKNNVLQVYSYRENVDLLWLRRIVMLFIAISILVFPLGVISYYGFHSIAFADYFFFVTLVLFIFFLGYWGYQQGQVFSFNSNIETFDEDESVEINSTPEIKQAIKSQFKTEGLQLQDIMKKDKPYLEPSLTIHALAGMVGLPPHHLSKVINREFHCNFFEYVNNYRIDEFKQRAFQPEFKHLTILGIALECGFNSKSAFNRIFKDITGLTPGDFIKNHKP